MQQMYQKVIAVYAGAISEGNSIPIMCSRWSQKVIVQYAADASESQCIICRGWNQMTVQHMISECNFTQYPAGGIRKRFYLYSVQHMVPDGDFTLYSTFIR